MSTLKEIRIPDEYLAFASQWYSGQDDMMYALASTGDIGLGSIRPRDDDGAPMSDHAWHVYLWECLECDVRSCRYGMNQSYGDDDYDTANNFEDFCEATVRVLRAEYGLAE